MVDIKLNVLKERWNIMSEYGKRAFAHKVAYNEALKDSFDDTIVELDSGNYPEVSNAIQNDQWEDVSPCLLYTSDAADDM
jgi:hypothetical protein